MNVLKLVSVRKLRVRPGTDRKNSATYTAFHFKADVLGDNIIKLHLFVHLQQLFLLF